MRYATFTALLAAIVFSALTTGVSAGSPPARGRAQADSICSLTARDATRGGAPVDVTAFYITDYEERSRLVDPNCKSKSVAFKFIRGAVGPSGQGASKELESAIVQDMVQGHHTGVYQINFTGRFVYREHMEPHVMLYINRVWSFERMPCTAFFSTSECR